MAETAAVDPKVDESTDPWAWMPEDLVSSSRAWFAETDFVDRVFCSDGLGDMVGESGVPLEPLSRQRPGARVGLALEWVDRHGRGSCEGGQLEDVMLASIRQQAHLEAQMVRHVVELMLDELGLSPHPVRGMVGDWNHARQLAADGQPLATIEADPHGPDIPTAASIVAPVIAAKLGRPRGACRRYAETAWALAADFPTTLTALDQGVIEFGHAEVIADELRTIGHRPDDRARIEAETVAWLRHEQTENNVRKTKEQTRRRIVKAILRIDVDAARRRYLWALARRGLRLNTHHPNYDGTATLELHGVPLDVAVDVHARFLHEARRLHDAGDERTVGQLAHDLALRALTGGPYDDATGPSRPRGKIMLTVPLAEVLGQRPDSGRAELSGYGPVITEVARRIVDNHLDNPHADYLVACTDQNGRLVQLHKLDKNRFFGSGLLRDSINGLWSTCAHPHCETSAVECHGDHRRDHARGGTTTQDNGNPLCAVHDGDLGRRGWTKDPVSGRPDQIVWTDPHGETYRGTAPRLLEPDPSPPEPREVDEPPPF